MSMIPLIIYIFAFFFSLALGIFVLKSGRKIEHKLFGLLSLIIMLWILFDILIGIVQDIFFIKLTYSMAALMIPVALIWVEYFAKGKCSKKYLIILTLLSSVFFILPLIGDLMMYDVHSFTIGYGDGEN